MRTPIIAGNWKMNETIAEARALVTEMRAELSQLAAEGRVQIVLCPPYFSVPAVAELAKGTLIGIGAQD